MRVRQLCVIAIALSVATFIGKSYGQVKFWHTGNAIVVETSAGTCIPDPNDKLSLISLVLNNSTIQRELGLSKDELATLRRERQRNGGSFSSPARVLQTIEESNATESALFFAAARRKNEAILDEIISPDQWKRLRELAYQTEIAIVGLAGAVVDGRLGRDIGVYENQKSRLSLLAAKLDSNVAVAIANILRTAQSEVLSELTPSQRTTAVELLGTPFHFRDDDTSMFQRMQSAKPNGYSIVDPRDDYGLILVIQNKSVQTELDFDETKIERFNQLLAKFKAGGNFGDLSVMLTAKQWTRLREIDYQIEVARVGLGKALTTGYLARDVGILENQKPRLVERCSEIEKEAGREIVKVLAEAQAAFLENLVPEQRIKAKELIGQPFHYRPDDFTTYLQLEEK